MSAPGQPAGLSLDQAPPLAIPLSFFLTMPAFVLVAGAWVSYHGPLVFLHRAAPITLALTHVGTLGVLAMVMFGALYQMLPVVVASPVPHVRLAHAVHGLLVAGTLTLLLALSTGAPGAYQLASGLLCTCLLLLGPVARALWRRRADAGLGGASAALGGFGGGLSASARATLWGMRVALGGLGVLAFGGLWLSLGAAGRLPTPMREAILVWHIGTALLEWVGGLITAVSWQVVPMFYLTPEVPSAHRQRLLRLLASGLLLPGLAIVVAATTGLPAGIAPATAVAWGLGPAAIATLVYNPWLIHRAITARRRRLTDPSRHFWHLGLACAPLCALLALSVQLTDDPRPALAFGWLSIWGWAGSIVLGMLHRIVPFLVWFHRCAPLIGAQRVPSARQLLPDGHARVSLRLHAATVGTGLAAIAGGHGLAARLTGALLIATALHVGHTLWRVARYRPSTPAAPAATAATAASAASAGPQA